MNTKFRYSFIKASYIIYGILVAVVLAASIFSILRLAGAANLISNFPALDIVTTVLLLAILVVFTLVIVFSNYSFKNEMLVLNCVIYFQKIKFTDIVTLRIDEKADIMALYFKDTKNSELLRYIVICIPKSNIESFINKLKELCPHVMVEKNA